MLIDGSAPARSNSANGRMRKERIRPAPLWVSVPAAGVAEPVNRNLPGAAPPSTARRT